MLEGIILKGYSGFYYVQADAKEWECSLRGRYRIKSQDFLVGDKVLIQPIDTRKAVIEKVLPRITELYRPLIANVEQVMIVMALKQPEPDLVLLDRLLVLAEIGEIKPVICFNKSDLVSEAAVKKMINIYKRASYPICVTSVKEERGIATVQEMLRGRISVFAGPSGVGKSSLLNKVQPGISLKTGQISEKSLRGRHTTRHVELLKLEGGGLVADTPGFNRLNLPSMHRETLTYCFPEMSCLAYRCKFSSCLHWTEPGCAVKEAVEKGLIINERYQNYLRFLEEVIENERSY